MPVGFTDLTNTPPAIVSQEVKKNDYGNFELNHYKDDTEAYFQAHKAWMDSPDNDERMTKISDLTPSMLGSGLAGSHVIYKKQPTYEIGDAVIYPSWKGGNHTGIHRIVAVDPVKGVYTKGTFNNVGDGWTPFDKVVGKVTKAFQGRKK